MTMKHWGISLLSCASLLLSACTVVDLDAEGKPILPKDPRAKASYSNQTPQQVAEETWKSKVMTSADKALDWDALQTHGTILYSGVNKSVFVKAEGQVTAFNHANERERSLTITFNGEPVRVQIGPVIRSNTLRDAAGFSFEDFTNQVQFAQLTRALNRHAVKQLPPIDESWLQKPVRVVMAVKLNKTGVEDAVAVVLKQETP